MLLIIEDDKMINSLLGRVLQDNGYETESAFDGAEGLKLALEKNYELILLDLMLPQKRGEEVIDAIRKVKNIPVIVLSAKTDVANRIELLRLGVDDYIRPGENDILLLDDVSQALTALTGQEIDELVITLTPGSDGIYTVQYDPAGVYITE